MEFKVSEVDGQSQVSWVSPFPVASAYIVSSVVIKSTVFPEWSELLVEDPLLKPQLTCFRHSIIAGMVRLCSVQNGLLGLVLHHGLVS